MKYLKKFNESIGDVKFCAECGTELPKIATFCSECGEKQDDNFEGFTISGKIEASYPNGQKTPNFTIVSLNKNLSGTRIIFDKSINKFEIPVDQEVTISGTTQDGLPPKFNNPIIVSNINDVVTK